MERSNRIDLLVERLTRRRAQQSSRRSFLTRLGGWVAGGALIPVLPIDRVAKLALSAQAQALDPTQDPKSCDYWRHCAFDGFMCSCCGGGRSTCPPGTVASPTSWIGSCENPEDGETYLINYKDCCGKGSCGRCGCVRTEGELPVYRASLNNDIIWCFGAPAMTYHCTTGALIGRVEETEGR